LPQDDFAEAEEQQEAPTVVHLEQPQIVSNPAPPASLQPVTITMEELKSRIAGGKSIKIIRVIKKEQVSSILNYVQGCLSLLYLPLEETDSTQI
jgi:hypothetical protein